MTTSSSNSSGGIVSTPQKSIVLGVDGGGTKTLAWLATVDANGKYQVIGRGASGSSNRVAAGLEASFANLAAAIQQARDAAGSIAAPIAKAVFALAGAGTDHVQQQILRFTQQKDLQISSARVVHDGQAVLQAGTPDGMGIALIAGTGTVAYGVNECGATAVVGGWGYWFGDEGSAYWLGQEALRAISHADDGRARSTMLTEAVLERLRLDGLRIHEPRQILTALSNQADVRQAIAGLADVVCAAADQQDDVAKQILARAAQHWSQHVSCLAQKLAFHDPFHLAVAGGVLCGSQVAKERLQEEILKDRISTSSVEFVDEPVQGCVEIACRELFGSE